MPSSRTSRHARFRLLAAVVASGLWTGAAHPLLAQTPPAPDSASDAASGLASGLASDPADPFPSLLRELRDDDWRTRQRAQDELISLGPDVRPRVVESLNTADSEDLRTRLVAVLRQMDEIRFTGPSIVSLRA